MALANQLWAISRIDLPSNHDGRYCHIEMASPLRIVRSLVRLGSGWVYWFSTSPRGGGRPYKTGDNCIPVRIIFVVISGFTVK